MNKKFQILAFLAILVTSSFMAVFAQSTTGSISGTVADESQALIPNATVTVNNTDTGLTRTAQTANATLLWQNNQSYL